MPRYVLFIFTFIFFIFVSANFYEEATMVNMLLIENPTDDLNMSWDL